MPITKYDFEYVQAELAVVECVATGFNQTQYVLKEAITICPYDPKTLEIKVQDPCVFLTKLTVNVILKTIDEKTGLTVATERPSQYQQDLHMVPNQIIIANLLGTVSQWSDDDLYLSQLTQSIENEVRNYKIPYQPNVNFYKLSVETPEDNPDLHGLEVCMELPYLTLLKEKVEAA